MSNIDSVFFRDCINSGHLKLVSSEVFSFEFRVDTNDKPFAANSDAHIGPD